MIRTFKCSDTQHLYETGKSPLFSNVRKVAERKLQQLDSAVDLESLRAPPGNKLEALQGNRKGQHSIRINNQWRVCFVWTAQGPVDVEIVDYH